MDTGFRGWTQALEDVNRHWRMSQALEDRQTVVGGQTGELTGIEGETGIGGRTGV